MEEERKKLFDSEMEIEVVEEAAPNMFAGLNQERKYRWKMINLK